MATTDLPAVPPVTAETPGLTAEELAARVGPVPLNRIRMTPPPGTATEADITAAERQGPLCELVDGVLVEKAVSAKSSKVALLLGALLVNFVMPRKLGFLLTSDGFVRLPGLGSWRAPDVAFYRGGDDVLDTAAYPEIAPALAIEILSPGNTPGEMLKKTAEYFAAGTELVWIIDPQTRTATVHTAPDEATRVEPDGVLDGDDVLPGFRVTLADLFPPN
ncbi:MAG: Uma2 family endonuclease [Planctomycetota bacterium]